jgi:predicted dehydrogenase
MKLAVLGCGNWGKNLVRDFRELGVLAAVVDPTDAGRAAARKLAPDAVIEAAAARVLADPTIDAVAIAAPSELHAPLTGEALRARKHVFCEKPLALSYADGRRVVDLARQRGKVLMVGHILDYHPGIRALFELVERGELGEVRYVFSNRLNLGKIGREENILWSFAPHDIALLLRLVPARPIRIAASGAAFVRSAVADVTVTTLAFENGVAAHVFVSWLNPFKEQKLVVIGSKKMATFDDVAKELVLHDQRIDWHAGEPVPVRGEGMRVAYSLEEPLRIECAAFVRAVDHGEAPRVDGEAALEVVRLLELAGRSLASGGAPIDLTASVG